MEHIAFAVQKDPTDVRLANMRADDNDLPALIQTWKQETDYETRLQSTKEFNNANRWMKKAIKISVMDFLVKYNRNFTAFVSIYQGDGSVTVSTGGVEMGQGLHTKVAQVCAYKLGVPLDLITVLPNYSFTAAKLKLS
jgi:xanthine dehydrogenase/oxidase